MSSLSAKGSCFSWVLKEPGTYRTRTGGHWRCRARISLFQSVGAAKGEEGAWVVVEEVQMEKKMVHRVRSWLRVHCALRAEMHLRSQELPRWAPALITLRPHEVTLSSEPSLSKDKASWGKTIIWVCTCPCVISEKWSPWSICLKQSLTGTIAHVKVDVDITQGTIVCLQLSGLC